MRAVVLLSPGRHPVSGRPCPVAEELRAIRLAREAGADVSGLAAGTRDNAVSAALGHGIEFILLLHLPPGADPLAPLAAELAADPPDLVLASRSGRGGDDTGLLPYALAHSLGWPIVADAAELAFAGAGISVTQALPRGMRRRILARLPAVVTVHPAAPPPLPFAFAAARRGRIEERAAALSHPASESGEERPYRRRPRLIEARQGSAAERLKAAIEIASVGGRVLLDPAPEQAAEEILACLTALGVVGG